ncbi:MAG TPA: serine/threonine-protein kinase, partial [Myxococcota bacterium]
MIAGLEILNLHAQGGMAEVYRARGKGADGRTWSYAVKRILPELTSNAELRQMFIEEARVASLLVHPNIVRVYDLAKSELDELYIVMEFLEGRDLSEAIDRAIDLGRTVPVWAAIHCARAVLNALIYATTTAVDREGRALALIHRDISPHNIFVCFDGQVKLTDFGVAKVAQSSVLTQVGVTKGKFGYMSPEQLMSDRLDFRSDLYNVGILLYEALTCRRLFYGDNASQFLQAMLKGEVPALDPALRVPPELEALMRRALSKDRDVRPASAAQFDVELAQIAARYGLSASHEHVAAEMRTIFGSEVESCAIGPVSSASVPALRPATAPKRLASISAALPEVVARRIPAAAPPQIVPAQMQTRGLSDASLPRPVPLPTPPTPRTPTPKPQPSPIARSAHAGNNAPHASSSSPRPTAGTTSVRPLDDEP